MSDINLTNPMVGFKPDMNKVREAILDAEEAARDEGDEDGSAYYLSTWRRAEIVAECVRQQAVEYASNPGDLSNMPKDIHA